VETFADEVADRAEHSVLVGEFDDVGLDLPHQLGKDRLLEVLACELVCLEEAFFFECDLDERWELTCIPDENPLLAPGHRHECLRGSRLGCLIDDRNVELRRRVSEHRCEADTCAGNNICTINQRARELGALPEAEEPLLLEGTELVEGLEIPGL